MSHGVTDSYHHSMKRLSMHDGVSKRTPVYTFLIFTRWKYKSASMQLRVLSENCDPHEAKGSSQCEPVATADRARPSHRMIKEKGRKEGKAKGGLS